MPDTSAETPRPDKPHTWTNRGVRGSDAKIIAGNNAADWDELRRKKLGLPVPPPPPQRQLLMDMGKALEPVILRETVRAFAKGGFISDHQMRLPYLSQIDVGNAHLPAYRATLDLGYVHPDNSELVAVGVEAKFHAGTQTPESLAEYYAPQMQHQMFCTGCKDWWLSVLYGFRGRHTVVQVSIDEEWLTEYRYRAQLFIEYVATGELPEEIFGTAPMADPKQNAGRIYTWKPQDNNEATAHAITIIETREAAKKFDEAKDAFKDLVPKDAGKVLWLGPQGMVVVRRTKRGLVLSSE